MRKSEFDFACLIELLDLLCGKFDIHDLKIRAQLIELARPNNGDDRIAIVPRQISDTRRPLLPSKRYFMT